MPFLEFQGNNFGFCYSDENGEYGTVITTSDEDWAWNNEPCMAPLMRLEQRADERARGELADPVAAGGEGEEIGRLTLALEEMRRALRDKLRSTEEVNLDLERATQRFDPPSHRPDADNADAGAARIRRQPQEHLRKPFGHRVRVGTRRRREGNAP